MFPEELAIFPYEFFKVQSFYEAEWLFHFDSTCTMATVDMSIDAKAKVDVKFSVTLR